MTLGLAACRAPHSSSWARSSSSSSSVRASGSLCEACFEDLAFDTALHGCRDGHDPAAVRAFARHGPICRRNFQPAAAGAKESQETIAGSRPSRAAAQPGAAGSLPRTWGSRSARDHRAELSVFRRTGRSPEA